jgi:hypothetical protein
MKASTLIEIGSTAKIAEGIMERAVRARDAVENFMIDIECLDKLNRILVASNSNSNSKYLGNEN